MVRMPIFTGSVFSPSKIEISWPSLLTCRTQKKEVGWNGNLSFSLHAVHSLHCCIEKLKIMIKKAFIAISTGASSYL